MQTRQIHSKSPMYAIKSIVYYADTSDQPQKSDVYY